MRHKLLIITVLLSVIAIPVSGQYTLPNQLLNGSILLTSKSKTAVENGSGFFYQSNDRIFIITAAHVLFSLDTNYLGQDSLVALNDSISVTFYRGNVFTDDPNVLIFSWSALFKENRIIVDKGMDVAVINIGIVSGPSKNIVSFYDSRYIKRTNGTIMDYDFSNSASINSVQVTDDAFIFGYPKSLGLPKIKLYDSDRPLLRKGAIAGIDKINKTIILDCPAYPGNSGGPVFEVRGAKYYLIGLVDKFIPFEESSVNLIYKTVNTRVNNSGYTIVVPIDFVDRIVNAFFKS